MIKTYHTFERVEDCIQGLKTEDGTYVINSKKRIGFVSVLFNILTVKKLYETLVIPEQLSYISTWYLNQDRKAFKMDYTRYQVEDNRYTLHFSSECDYSVLQLNTFLHNLV